MQTSERRSTFLKVSSKGWNGIKEYTNYNPEQGNISALTLIYKRFKTSTLHLNVASKEAHNLEDWNQEEEVVDMDFLRSDNLAVDRAVAQHSHNVVPLLCSAIKEESIFPKMK